MNYRNLPLYQMTLFFISLTTSTSLADVVLDDMFANGRSTQNLPDSAAWYARQGTSSVNVVSEELVINLSGSEENNGVLGYFAGSGTPRPLAESETLSLAFDLTFNSVNQLSGVTDRLRIGLMNSGGSRVSTDNTNFNNSAFADYEGYWSFLSLNGVAASRITKRTGSNNALPTGNAVSNLGSTEVVGDVLRNVTYQVSLDITRTGPSTNTITTTIGGLAGNNSFTRVDTNSILTSFDTAVISFHDPNTTSATISRIQVTAVPEPSPFMYLGLLAVVAAYRRCKFRRTRLLR